MLQLAMAHAYICTDRNESFQTYVLSCPALLSSAIRKFLKDSFLLKKELPQISYHLIDSLNSIRYLYPSYKDQLYIIMERSKLNASQHEWRNTNDNT